MKKLTTRVTRRATVAATGLSVVLGLGLSSVGADATAAPATEPTAGDPEDIALAHLRGDPAEVGVTRADVAELGVESSYRSPVSGVTHVNVGQRHEGLEVFGAVATVNVAEDGRVVYVGGRLERGLQKDASGAVRIGPAAALRAAADELDLKRPKQVRVLEQRPGKSRMSVLSKSGVSEDPIPARVGWQPTDDGLRRAWQLVIDDVSAAHLWNATVDAQTGDVLDVEDWTAHDNAADLARTLGRPAGKRDAAPAALTTPDPVDDGSSYRVFALPGESPNDGPRSLVRTPADATGSPYGWHDTDGADGAEYTTTRGNNVHAYLDQDNDSAPDFGGPPFEPHNGDVYVWSQASDISYKRLTREIAVPDAGGSLTFWTRYGTEAGWDHMIVEARTAGGDDWTTLPDANGHTSQDTGESCPAMWRQLHPQLDHYQRYDYQQGVCTPEGTTGSWNAASGVSDGWEEWSVDLSDWAGGTVEVSIAYVTDWGGQYEGVAVDDITLPDGATATFEDGLDGWAVSGAPQWSAPNPNDWTRTDPGSISVGDTDGGPGLDFDFPADVDQHPQNYRDAAVTNLFYWNNIVHDVMYRFGFDEAAGNFQSDNYGRGGTGGDYVRAEAADGGGTDNANFSTPIETPEAGGLPVMQMYLWPGDQLGPQNQVVVDGAGSFGASWSRFGAAPTPAGTSGRFHDAGDGCTAADYAGHPGGDWIAVVTGGAGCADIDKAHRAEAAGAAAIVVAAGAEPSVLTGPQNGVMPRLAVASVSADDGDRIRAAIAAGPVTGTVRQHPDHPGIRDGDLDAGVVIHEYGHGVSTRLTGGPSVNCLGGDEQVGEGWSDYFALAMLLDPEQDDPEKARGMGPYVTHGDDRHAPGIRPAPYSRNMAIQPATYDSIKNSGWLDARTLQLGHGIGHVWTAVLWDMTWDLIDKHGFNPDLYGDWASGGNTRALQYVIEGLKYQGCYPGMLDARDAIIAAADELSGGEDTCTIWSSFARRGFGYSATQGTFINRNDNDEAFDTHPDCVDGFLGKVADEPRLNEVQAGSAVQLDFDARGDTGLDVLASGSPYSRQVDCETLQTVDPRSLTITPRPLPVPTETPGSSGLRYNRGKKQYTYPWKTEKAWRNTCREVVLTRADGTQHRAYFKFGEQETPPSPVLQRWLSRFNGPGNLQDTAEAGVLSPDGSKVFVTGRSEGNGTGLDYATIAYDTATGEELWNSRYNGPPGDGHDIAWAIAVSPDGSRVYVTGQSMGKDPITDYATVAYDADTGKELWVARNAGPANGLDVARAVAVSPDGAQVFVTGQQLGVGTTLDFATIAYDAETGEEQWLTRYNGTSASGAASDIAVALTVTPDGSKVLVAGESSGDRSGSDFATVAYDTSDGTELWVGRYNGPGNRADEPHAMALSPDGSRVFVTGQSQGVDTLLSDFTTVAYDVANGSELWAKQYNGPGDGNDVPRAVTVAPDGKHVFVSGSSFVSEDEGTDYATIAYDAADGSQGWLATYNGPGRSTEAPWAMAISPDGSRLVVAGQSFGVGADPSAPDFGTVSYDPATGTQLWEARYHGGRGADIPRWVGFGPDGTRVYVTGQSWTADTDDDYATLAYDIVPLEE